MDEIEISEQGKTTGSSNKQDILLTVIGIIIFIAGICIATIHNPLRELSLGTALIVIGVVLAAIGIIRFRNRNT
jgi:hypothetical protein